MNTRREQTRSEAIGISTEALVSIRSISKSFARQSGFFGAQRAVPAVSQVSLDVMPGKTMGIVGESGCGKSTLGRMAVGVLQPSGGDIFIRGLPLYSRRAHADYRAFRKSLAGVVQMIFQDPYSSLNPRMSIGQSVAEPLLCSSSWRNGVAVAKDEITRLVHAMLEMVGLGKDAAKRFPHEFSGGQRQRVAIARALVTRPAFVVCDEPTSSLDASVQSQVLNLLRDLQDSFGLACLFISHDLAVVRHMSDRVAVMYQGRVVEEGDADLLFAAPLHPYTRLLLDSVPGSEKIAAMPTQAAVEVPDRPPADGCSFAPRCPGATDACRKKTPELRDLGDGRKSRCIMSAASPGARRMDAAI